MDASISSDKEETATGVNKTSEHLSAVQDEQKILKLASLKQPHEPSPSTTILLGLSGPSSSGKTTLARLLRTIFNISVSSPVAPSSSTTQHQQQWTLSLFILHQDDFYLTDALVPVISVSSEEFGTRDLQDWDCVESLDLKIFEDTLRHVKLHGRVPEGSMSKEDQNAVGESGVSDDEVRQLKEVVEARFKDLISSNETAAAKGGDVATTTREREIRICILDGFLLYPPAPPPSASSSTTQQAPSSPSPAPPLETLHRLTHELLTPRLFLPSTRAQTLSRRQRRTGYVTLEGFWTDPPGYVEDVVWPNYARDHAWMYTDGDVDCGQLDEERLLRDDGVLVCPGQGSWDMKRVLHWAVEAVVQAVRERVG
jgi:nicotinamide/nicotinate riboside kinase